MAKSETNSIGFSTKSIISSRSFILITPNCSGLGIRFTHNMPSSVGLMVKSARNKVSAKATTVGPDNKGAAHNTA